jgi:hypothetical protein
MGVRGTDFIVALGESGTGLYTIDGTVDIADDMKALKTGEGSTAVEKGHQVTAAPAHDPLTPNAFAADEFLKVFNKKHPRIEGLTAAARKAIASGELRKRYESLHQANAAEAEALKSDGTTEMTFGGKKKAAPKAKPAKK